MVHVDGTPLYDPQYLTKCCGTQYFWPALPNCVNLLTGPEHQELQVPTLADTAQLPVPASPATDRHPATEQSDGTVVSHALPHASSVRLTQRVQGVVRQPADEHGRRHQRVQRESHTTATQSEWIVGYLLHFFIQGKLAYLLRLLALQDTTCSITNE